MICIETVHRGAVERIRPMSMTGLANIFGLIPVMWATGTGADVMKRLAAPMVGGVLLGHAPDAVRHSGGLCRVALVEGAKRKSVERCGGLTPQDVHVRNWTWTWRASTIFLR